MNQTPPSPPAIELAVTTGMSEGTKLRDCRRITHTMTAAVFNENMTVEQWTDYGRHLATFKKAMSFYQADWLNFGRAKFGGQIVQQTVEQLGFNFDDIEKASAIALVPAENRMIELSDCHYETIGLLIDQGKLASDDAGKWLTIAREEGLTEGELHDSVIEGKVMKKARPTESHSNRSGFLSIHGITTTFSRWVKNVDKQVGGVEKMAPEQKKEILTELEPIVALYSKLKSQVVPEALPAPKAEVVS